MLFAIVVTWGYSVAGQCQDDEYFDSGRHCVGCSTVTSNCASCSDALNLVVNGDFEDPVVSTSSWYYGTECPGWILVGDYVEYQTPSPSYHGNQYIELSAEVNYEMYQYFRSEVGTQYKLQFAYSPRPGCKANSSVLQVTLDGVTHGPYSRNSPSLDWSFHEFTFTGTGTHLLHIEDVGLNDDKCGALIDDLRFYTTNFCLGCDDGYYLTDHDECEVCTTAIANCGGCGFNVTSTPFDVYCFDCLSALYVNEHETACCDRPNCETCPTSTCTNCAAGYFFSVDGTACCPTDHCAQCCDDLQVCVQCEDGYYGSGTSTCALCFTNCDECETASTCETCATGYYLNDSGTQCCTMDNCVDCATDSVCTQCIVGYYVNGADECSSCISDCDVCSDSIYCTQCTGYYYLNVDSTDCCQMQDCVDCAADPTVCTTCPTGFYGSGTSICLPCFSHCSQCTDHRSCVVCDTGYYLSTLGLQCCLIDGCVLCDNGVCIKCPTGQVLTAQNTCQGCPNYCNICEQSGLCSKCNSGYTLKSDGTECCIEANCEQCSADGTACENCQQGYYLSQGNCTECISNCEACVDSSSCDQCATDYTFNSEFQRCCVNEDCDDCSGSSFSAELVVDSETVVYLIFEESLQTSVTELVVEIENVTDFQWTVHAINSTVVEVVLEFESDIPVNATIGISIDQAVYSLSNNCLTLKSFSGTLPGWMAAGPESLGEEIEVVVMVGLAAVLLLTLVHCNWSLLWCVLGLLEILSIAPLTNLDIPHKLFKFFRSLNLAAKVPLFLRMWLNDQGHAPVPRAEQYGYTSTDFIINSGVHIALFSGLGVLYLFVELLMLFPRLGRVKWLATLSQQFHYGIFLRAWVSSCLLLELHSFLCLIHVTPIQMNDDELHGTLNSFFSLLVVVFFIQAVGGIFPVFFATTLAASRSDVTWLETARVNRQWKELLYELKTSHSLFGTQYYSVFVFRRLVYAAGLVCARRFVYVQCSLNFASSLLMMVYLGIVRPFKLFVVQWTNLLAECCILFVFTLLPFFLLEPAILGESLLTVMIIWTSLSAILICVLASFVLFLKELNKYCRFSKNPLFYYLAPGAQFPSVGTRHSEAPQSAAIL